jgi:putative DNA primase/helicase
VNHTADDTKGQERPPKPSALPVIPEHIPPDLKDRPNWVFWRWTWIEKRGIWDKPPLQSRGGNLADSSNPKTWSGFEAALNAYHYEESHADGIGYMFVKKNHEVGGDLDECRDPETGAIAPWAQQLIDAFDTYTEISPSGTGVHFIAQGNLPGRGLHVGKIELYDSGRYFCMTGHHLPGTPLTPEPRQEAITNLCQHLRAQQSAVKKTADPSPHGAHRRPTLDDDTIIQRALGASNGRKFARLWAGEFGDYPSQSEADLALCRELVYWTEDPEQLDRLLRRSGLMRDKWEHRADYREWTITKAIETPHDSYRGVSAEANGQPDQVSHLRQLGQRNQAEGRGVPPPADPPEPDPEEWKADLSRTNGGEVRETLGNIAIALTHLQPWSQECWYDAVRDIRMLGHQELDDTLVTQAGLRIEEETGMPIRSRYLIPTALTYLCRQKPRDLLREWLESLPAWDGKVRLAPWLQTYAHAPRGAYSEDVSRLLIEGMVARALDPGCQYRCVVILEGPENIGKSKLVRALATPEWYRELSHSLDGKEAHMRVKRAWVAELAELSSFSKTEEARLKSFFTLNEDAYIPKFSNFEVVHKRRTVFIGTINPEADNTYLRGQTGNTRYLPISVYDIDVEGFQLVRNQLFAEALKHYDQHMGDWWQLSSDGEAAAQELREERRQRSVYEDELGMWLERAKKTVTWWEEIANDFLVLPRAQWADRRQSMEIAKALKAIGWEKGRRERISGDLVWPWRPGDDWRPEP